MYTFVTSKSIIYGGRNLLYKKYPDEIKIIHLYRYLSLFITSFFYCINNDDLTIGKKVMVVGCISISSIILNYLYIKNIDSKPKIKFLILIETIGNSFILIPAGGINSAYIWYSLNTILIASIELDKIYCWLNLLIYIFISTYISSLVFGFEQHEFNLILSFILITAAIQLLAKYLKKIQQESLNLIEANKQIKESMNFTMELYQAVHLLTNETDKANLISLIVYYTKKITKTDISFFYQRINDNSEFTCESSDKDKKIKDKVALEISKSYKQLANESSYMERTIDNKPFILISINSDYSSYGILGISVPSNKTDYKETIEELKLLAEFSSASFKRFELQGAEEKLIVSEEQNRIANEIHDGVLQRLFSISCGIYYLSKRLKTLSIESAKEELNIIRSSINSAMEDLRTAIYDLSWKKGGTNNFIVSINNHINEIKSLNNIDIDFNILGDSEKLSLLQKRYLYRIISEALSNAVRHGKASYIEIIFNIEDKNTTLKIEDNGTGFNLEEIKQNNRQGLGIQNIENLVYLLNGKVQFYSKLGDGTKINIVIPTNNIYTSQEEEYEVINSR